MSNNLDLGSDGENVIPDLSQERALLLLLDEWPTIDKHSLSAEKREKFERRCEAIRRYAEGDSYAEIRRDTGLRSRDLHHLIRRANQPHPDGRIHGYRAIVPNMRTTPHVRRKKLSFAIGDNQAGGTGAFSALLRQYPVLADLIERRVFPKSARSPVSERKINKKNLHNAFINKCREIGLAERRPPGLSSTAI